VQDQQKFVWPASFALARAYLDQLQRGNGMSASRITAVRASLASAERLSGAARKEALSKLAAELHSDANNATDKTKAHTLAGAVEALAGA
jgi:dsRNA-specific ribonuclease